MDDFDDTIISIVAILASKKHAIELSELQHDFTEINGSPIPYAKFRFGTLLEMLEAVPDKILVERNPYTNVITAHHVVNETLFDLTRLVAGQKTTKPKYKYTKAMQTSSPNLYTKPSHHKFMMTQPHRLRSPTHTQQPVTSNYTQQPVPIPDPTKKKHYAVYNYSKHTDVRDLPVVVHYPATMSMEQLPLMSIPALKKLFEPVTTHLPKCTDLLHEDRVRVIFVDDSGQVYVRLSNVTSEYAQMMNEMDQFYILHRREYTLEHVTESVFCVAYDQLHRRFFRVQVKKTHNDHAQCYFVDEGYTQHIDNTNFLSIKNEFTKLKFQAIAVQLKDFTQLDYSDGHVVEWMRDDLIDKEFVARKINEYSTPITVSFYDENNEPCDAALLKAYLNNTFKPVVGEIYNGYIEFICENDATQVFMSLADDMSVKFDKMTNAVNELLDSVQGDCYAVSLKYTNMSDIVGNIFCVRYTKDTAWFRAKVVEPRNDTQVLVSFIDIGDVKIVNIGDLRYIPGEFRRFQLLQARAFLVLVIQTSAKSEQLTYKAFNEDATVQFKVIRLDSFAVTPFVEFMELDAQQYLLFESETKTECAWSKLNDDTFLTVFVENLATPDLPDGSKVIVSHLVNPFDFVLNLECLLPLYKVLMSEMKEFYAERNTFLSVTNLTVGQIYAYQNELLDVSRVHLVGLTKEDATVKMHLCDIDTGKHIVVTESNNRILRMASRFIQLEPLGIRARFKNFNYDETASSFDRMAAALSDKMYWSASANLNFSRLVQNGAVFKANILHWDTETSRYTVELFDTYGRVVSTLLHRTIDTKSPSASAMISLDELSRKTNYLMQFGYILYKAVVGKGPFEPMSSTMPPNTLCQENKILLNRILIETDPNYCNLLNKILVDEFAQTGYFVINEADLNDMSASPPKVILSPSIDSPTVSPCIVSDDATQVPTFSESAQNLSNYFMSGLSDWLVTALSVKPLQYEPYHGYETLSFAPMLCVTKWFISKSNDGIAYQLSDKSCGFHFSDSTKIVLGAVSSSFRYIKKNGENFVYDIHAEASMFRSQLTAKITEFQKAREFMDRYIKADHVLAQSGASIETCDLPYLAGWQKAPSATIFHLSNDTIQVNFENHLKVVVCPVYKAVTYVNAQGVCRTFQFAQLERYGCTNEVYKCLQYIQLVVKKVKTMSDH